MADRLLAKQSIARQDTTCYDWKPSNALIQEVKGGHCYQCQKQKEIKAKRMNVATLHKGEKGVDGEEDDEQCSVFLL